MAKSAAEKAEIPVSVIDSKGPTMSLGWQVLAAARTRDVGASIAEIFSRLLPEYGATRIVGVDTVLILSQGK